MELSRAQTDDPHRRELEAQVLSCEPEGDRYRVRLSETIFYPEGGGQPADGGRIGDARVLDVGRDDDGAIVHWVDEPVDEKRVETAVDWSRRLDHMQQHTAQHLLTAIADDEFGLPTVAFHLGDAHSTIDLEADRIADPTVDGLQRRANEEIRRGRPVSFRFVSPEKYASMEVRSRGLPDDHTGDVRILEIEGLDTAACGGTHVGNLAELQVVVVTGVERTRDRVRLSYLAGGRVVDRLEAALDRERALKDLLTCGREQHVDAVEETIDEAKRATNRVTDYQEELAGYLGRELAAGDGPVAALHRRETEFPFLNDIAREILDRDPERWTLLTAADPPDDDEGIFLVAGPEARVDEAGESVAEILEGRGGGPPGIYQGRAEALGRRDEALEFLKSME